ncbi:MAG: hypothetical protein M0Q93_04565, partial [Terrimicrobiaceae bacterium]|nr:hypothetical protein [Terrimicrobiaceae bacterium]
MKNKLLLTALSGFLLLNRPAHADLAFTSEPADQRMVVGAGTAPLLGFTLSNTSPADVGYAVSQTGFSLVNDLGLGTIFGNSTGLFSARPDFTGVGPGTTLNTTLTVTPTVGGAVSASAQIQAVQNRPLTGSLDLDAGRFLRYTGPSTYTSTSLGTFEISGGSLADNAATRVSTTGTRYQFGSTTAYLDSYDSHSGYSRWQALGASGGDLLLSRVSGSPQVILDSANESVSYAVGFTSTGSKDVTLGGSDLAILFTKEPLANSALDLAGTSLHVTGTSLDNRRFTISEVGSPQAYPNDGLAYGSAAEGLVVDLGRRMAGDDASYGYTGTRSLEVTSGQGDQHATRVVLGNGTAGNGGVILSTASETLFDNAAASASVGMDYDVTFDGNTTGKQVVSANLATIMASGEAGGALLAGQVIQDLKAGVALSVVGNRAVTANNVVVEALTGATVNAVTGSVESAGSDDACTRVKVLGQELRGDNSVTDTFGIAPVTSASATAEVHRGTRTLNIVGEGLDGENAQATVSYDYSTRFYNRASVSFLQNAGSTEINAAPTLGDGSVISYDITSGTNIAGVVGGLSVVSGYGFFSLDAVSGPGDSNYQINFSAPPGTNRLGGTFTSVLSGTFSHSPGYVGAAAGDVGQYYWNLSQTIARPSADSGAVDVSAGTRMQNVGITYGNSTFSNPTNVDILDSNPLSSSRTVEISFGGADLASGLNADEL